MTSLNYKNLKSEEIMDTLGILKGIVKSAEPSKCVILLVSRILCHKRINPSLKV